MNGMSKAMAASTGLILAVAVPWILLNRPTLQEETPANPMAEIQRLSWLAEAASDHRTNNPSDLGIPQQEESLGERLDDARGRRWQNWVQLRDPATGEIPAGIREKELAFAAQVAQRAVVDRSNYSTATWTNRGLWNVGGRTRALELDITDASVRTFLAGAISGGIWRTVDEGQNWTLVTADTDLYAPTSLIQDRRTGRGQTWYCGTGEFLGNSAGSVGASYFGSGIWKSADGGQTWTVLNATSPGSPTSFDSGFDFVWNVAIDVSNLAQDELYAATIGGIQRSQDGGQSWSFVRGSLAGQTLSNQNDVVVNPQGVVYASLDSDGPDKGIWRSTDGQNFTNITPPAMPSSYGRVVLGLAPSNSDVLWALVAPVDQGGHKLFKFTAGSGTWADRSAQLTGLPVAADQNNWTFDSQGGYDMVMKVKPDDENAVFIGGVHLIRSTDQFQSSAARAWVGGWLYPDPNQTPHEQHSDQHALVFHPTNPAIAFSGSDGGVWKTTNVMASTVRWTSLNNGYLSTQFYHAALDAGTPGSPVIACGLQDNGCWSVHSNSATASWIDQFGGDGCYVHIADGATSGGNFYFSSQYSFVYRIRLNSDGSFGDSFQRVDPVSLTDQNVLFVNPTALDPTDTRRMYMASLNGLWRANDVAAIATGDPNQETDTGWVQVTNIPNEYVTAITASRVPANVVYYGGFDVNARLGKLYKITNASNAPANTTPTNITGPNFPNGGYVNAIAVDPTDANRVLIAFSNYRVSSLFYTTNGGTSWTEVEGNLGGDDGPSVRSCLIMTASDNSKVYFAGTSTGLYSTASLSGGSTSWTPEGSSSIRNLIVAWLDGRPSDGTVLAGTHGGGAFTATISGGSQTCATRLADVSGDNQVDVTDLTRIINHIIGQQVLTPEAQLCADVSDDGLINIVDVVQTVRIILGLRPLPQTEETATLEWSRTWSPDLFRITLQSESLAAFQVDLVLTKGTRLVGAPRVEGMAEDALLWHQSGRQLTLLAPPDGGLSIRPGRIEVELTVAREAGSGDASPLIVGLLGVSPDGREIPAFELEGGAPISAGLQLLSLGPNPTRGPIDIRYRLPESGTVRASIHDATGRELRSLDSEVGAGEQSWRWDGRDAGGRELASGTYFVRIQAGQETSSRTFRVVR